ncbi:MAG: NAD(P)H-dependent oxidoreductase subunit E, partial [Cereibacter sp.]
MMTPGIADSAEQIGDILRAHDGLEGPLLPVLHAVQAAFGYIPGDALPVIAQHLNISRAEVH